MTDQHEDALHIALQDHENGETVELYLHGGQTLKGKITKVWSDNVRLELRTDVTAAVRTAAIDAVVPVRPGHVFA